MAQNVPMFADSSIDQGNRIKGFPVPGVCLQPREIAVPIRIVVLERRLPGNRLVKHRFVKIRTRRHGDCPSTCLITV